MPVFLLNTTIIKYRHLPVRNLQNRVPEKKNLILTYECGEKAEVTIRGFDLLIKLKTFTAICNSNFRVKANISFIYDLPPLATLCAAEVSSPAIPFQALHLQNGPEL